MQLKDIARIRTGIVLSRKKSSVVDNLSYPYPLVTLKAFNSDGTLSRELLDTFNSKEPIEQEYLTEAGDILIRLREPNIAAYIEADQTGWLVPSLVAIVKPDQKQVDGKFLTHYLNHSVRVKKSFSAGTKGTRINTINLVDLESIPVLLPSMEKQKELAAFFDLSQKEIQLLDELRLQKTQFYEKIFKDNIDKENN